MTKSHLDVLFDHSSADDGSDNGSEVCSEIDDQELYDLLSVATNNFILTFTEAKDRDEFKAYPLSIVNEGKMMKIIWEERKKMNRII